MDAGKPFGTFTFMIRRNVYSWDRLTHALRCYDNAAQSDESADSGQS